MTPHPDFPVPPYSYTREKATPQERERYRLIQCDARRYWWYEIETMAYRAPSLEEAKFLTDLAYWEFKKEEDRVLGP